MNVKQLHLRQNFTAQDAAALRVIDPTFLLVFGSNRFFADGQLGKTLRREFPGATVIGCSTAGEIAGTTVHDDTLVITAATLAGTLDTVAAPITDSAASKTCGAQLGNGLLESRPEAVFVLVPGVNVNGSDLVAGMQNILGQTVAITGGLAGDGGLFKQTYTLLNEEIYTNQAVAIAFASGVVKFGYGSQGGWQPFGPERTVTRAEHNILYEIDGKPALQLYKEYLGNKADGLPRSGLLYPLAVAANGHDKVEIIRTILNIDEAAGSLILAGSIENFSTVRLMHAKTDSLVEGARRASQDSGASDSASLAILISCVGRKLVMGDDVDDEIAAVHDTLGKNCVLAGFYSYGEIAPSKQSRQRTSHLQNQTMTISHLQDTHP